MAISKNARMSNLYRLEEPLAQDVPSGPGSGTTILASLAPEYCVTRPEARVFKKGCVEDYEMLSFC